MAWILCEVYWYLRMFEDSLMLRKRKVCFNLLLHLKFDICGQFGFIFWQMFLCVRLGAWETEKINWVRENLGGNTQRIFLLKYFWNIFSHDIGSGRETSISINWVWPRKQHFHAARCLQRYILRCLQSIFYFCLQCFKKSCIK